MSVRRSGNQTDCRPSWPPQIEVTAPSASAPKESARRAYRSAGAEQNACIWESELRAIAAEAAAWTVETGRPLWTLKLTRPSFSQRKQAPTRNATRAFRLDVEYLRQLSEPLAADWALRYFGDWHSHHRARSFGAELRRPQAHSVNLESATTFPNGGKSIVHDGGAHSVAAIVRIHPWFYESRR